MLGPGGADRAGRDAVDPHAGRPELGGPGAGEQLHRRLRRAVGRPDRRGRGRRGECTLGSLAGELGATDEQSREDLSNGFLRWQSLLQSSLLAMRDRGELRADADLDELSLALLTALQGGTLLSQTWRDTRPLRAALNAALAYVWSFAPSR
ncbi:TetR family transcriptional regulator C-terminal domain-containing protein [Paractinoplanes tereljensis]|nr:TetR family transcriptional regulator C-terminal domain-containing protein [Actinoplanes tereljensis]